MLTTIKDTAFTIKRFLNKKRFASAPNSTFQFPPEFDANLYKKLYTDLTQYKHDELYAHYINNGLKEGRRANILKDRIDFVKLIPKDKKVLEIGPFFNPLLSGEKVFYFDILDKEDLILRAKSLGLSQKPKNFPHIDFVSPTGNLEIINDSFDVVLSSHCIEHQVNLIKHLNNVEQLLNPGGYYFLLAPDKRYCLDHFIPRSNLAQIIESYIENRIFHPMRSFLECRALTTHNEASKHWKGDHGDPFSSIKERIENAIAECKKSLMLKEYVDLHAWYFIPTSFKKIIEGLNTLSYTRFTIERIYPTRYGTNEFWAILKKSF